MFTREELLQSPEYWFGMAQDDLFRQVKDYMERENLNQTQLAEKLGVSKGYVSQILNGNFNFTLKKLIELSIAIGKAPMVEYKALSQLIDEDKEKVYFSSVTSIVEIKNIRPHSATIEPRSIEATGQIKFVG